VAAAFQTAQIVIMTTILRAPVTDEAPSPPLGTRSAQRLRMHVTYFGLKRAYYSSMRITRPVLRELRLTPARFDMLTAITRHRGIFQSLLRRVLGVSAPVISRMVRALEALGFVVRTRSPYDKRQIRLSATPTALARMNAADEWSICSYLELAFDSAVAGEHWYDEFEVLLKTEQLEMILKRIRETFRDTASLYYPYGHPDD